MRPHISHGFSWTPLVLVLVAALAGCATGSSTSVGPVPTNTVASRSATPQGTPRGVRPSPVVGSLGPAPTDCTAVAPPDSFTSTTFGGGFSGTTTFLGSTPAWELGMGSSPLHMEQFSNGPTPYPSTKVMWVVGPNYNQPVTLTGHDLHSGATLWFQVYPSNGVATNDPDADSLYTTQAVLDPGAPNRGSTSNSTGHWNIWGVGLMVLQAGCYELDVSSQQGTWHTVFAAGR